MEKYIRVSDAVQTVMEKPDMTPDEKAGIIRRLKAVPAADVVEVVRCGQCKHCVEHYDTDGNAPYWTCKEWDSGTDYDGYCYYGERKDGGKDE